MALRLNLPTGYYQASLLFGGVDMPRGAAMTFGGSVGAGSPSAAATAINTAWNTHLKSVTPIAVQFLGTRVKFGPMDDGPFAYVSASIAGSKAGTSTTPNVSFLIRKLTAIGGRQGTGRLYQPGVGEADVDTTGTVAAGIVTNLQTAWNAFFNGLNSVSLPMYLIHNDGFYYTIDGDEAKLHTILSRSPTEVTSLTVDAKAATQRRRMRS